MTNAGWAALVGLSGTALFLVLGTISVLANKNGFGRRNPLILIEGSDRRLSTSKAQWFLWTAVIAGSYGAVYAARALSGLNVTVVSVPSNVLIALGFSATTMATAKGITANFAGRTAAKAAAPAGAGGLLTDDNGVTDLSKVQLMTWTFVALGVYTYAVASRVGSILVTHANLGLPDIDTALMALTGLSQGGYLGKKLVAP